MKKEKVYKSERYCFALTTDEKERIENIGNSLYWHDLIMNVVQALEAIEEPKERATWVALTPLYIEGELLELYEVVQSEVDRLNPEEPEE